MNFLREVVKTSSTNGFSPASGAQSESLGRNSCSTGINMDQRCILKIKARSPHRNL